MQGKEFDAIPKRKIGVHTPSVSFPDPDYSPGLSQVLIELEDTFWGTRFRITTPYNYEQSSYSTGAISLKLLRSLFQWSNGEEKASGCTSSAIVSMEKIGIVSVNMAKNNHDNDLYRCIEA